MSRLTTCTTNQIFSPNCEGRGRRFLFSDEKLTNHTNGVTPNKKNTGGRSKRPCSGLVFHLFVQEWVTHFHPRVKSASPISVISIWRGVTLSKQKEFGYFPLSPTQPEGREGGGEEREHWACLFFSPPPVPFLYNYQMHPPPVSGTDTWKYFLVLRHLLLIFHRHVVFFFHLYKSKTWLTIQKTIWTKLYFSSTQNSTNEMDFCTWNHFHHKTNSFIFICSWLKLSVNSFPLQFM